MSGGHPIFSPPCESGTCPPDSGCVCGSGQTHMKENSAQLRRLFLYISGPYRPGTACVFKESGVMTDCRRTVMRRNHIRSQR